MSRLLSLQDTVLEILKKIDSAKKIGIRPKFWDKVWGEEDAPPYFSGIVRIGGNFYDSPGYEEKYLQSLLLSVSKHVQGNVHEFGCGPGKNLEVFGPRSKGYDWSESACATVRNNGFDAERFDMFNPHKVGLKGTVLTVHAMEQLGSNFGPFLDFLMSEKPELCIHIEPIIELYDEGDLLDYLAKKYHKKGGYLEGFLNVISDKTIDIQKSSVSGMMHNAYTVVIWKP